MHVIMKRHVIVVIVLWQDLHVKAAQTTPWTFSGPPGTNNTHVEPLQYFYELEDPLFPLHQAWAIYT